jgi:hypothetical protein
MRELKIDLLSGGASLPYVDGFVPWNAGRAPTRIVQRRRKLQGASMGAGPKGGGQYTQQTNDAAQAAILALAQPMEQPLAPVTLAGANAALGSVSNILLNNVGLNTKLIIEISGTLGPAAAETLNRTPLGLANILSNVTLTDLNNVQRVNTTGWHLHLLATARNRGAFGAAFLNDGPSVIGSNYLVQNAPASIAANTAFRFFYEVPIAYHDTDLKGAIYAGVTSAQWRLQLTVNPNVVVASTATDATQACYRSTTAGNLGTLGPLTIQVYQCYWDQLPRSNGMPVLPALSLSYNYLLINTTNVVGAPGFDTTVFYPNFRTFLSTIFQFNNAGSLNAGTDVNYLAIQVANLTYLRKLDPFAVQLLTRLLIGDDFPAGHYYLDHRKKPIDTNQYGNTSFVVNPSVVNAGASLNLGLEMLAIQSQAINAGAFPSA